MPIDKYYLKHYGVLGMRWGHQKSVSSIQKKKKNEKAIINGHRAVKKILGSPSGKITIDVAGMSYLGNKSKVDSFILQKIGIHMP